MLHAPGAQDRFQFDYNLAINPSWQIQSSHGVCRAIYLCEAVGNGLIAYSNLTNGNQHKDVKPHTFCVQTKLDDRRVSMMVLSTPSLAWYSTVYVAHQVQAKTCNNKNALNGAW